MSHKNGNYDEYHEGRRVSLEDHLNRLNAQAAEISDDPYGLDPYDAVHFGPDEDADEPSADADPSRDDPSRDNYSKGYSREDGFYPSSYYDD